MKASSVLYAYTDQYLVFIDIIRPFFCQDMHRGSIDACKDDLVAPNDDPMDISSILGASDFNLW